MAESIRVGSGFDLHQWADDRKLILGGIEIPHEQGLSGHSDADALTHALIDALVGALALGDIGQHFPDTDPRFKDADSMEMLKAIMLIVRDHGYRVGNIDSTIVTDAPKMAPHIRKIRRNLADFLNVKENDVSVKATRPENVIFAPADGLLAMATVLLFKN
ncbi:2-C-methyl-D-erythritol 2,4-cyclodiphosphate synthase [bacterium]|nr:2-C-methyl-D-erythritol 2,4-cyclodiphosphate synthase [bacterium]